MDFYLLHKIIFLIAEIAVLFCGIWVYWSNRRNNVNKFFLLMSISIFWWLFFYYNLTIALDSPLTIWLPKLGYFSTSWFLIFFYLFFISLLRVSNKLLNKIVVGWWVFSAIISIFTGLVVRDVVFENNVFKDLILGEGAIIYYGSVLLTFCIILFFLFKKYYKSSHSERLKYQYFMVGVFIWVLMNVVFNVGGALYLNSIKYAALGNYSVIFFLAFTAYAIVKHELMGIKTLITQVLIVIISLILFIDVVLLSDNITMQLLKIGILLAFLYFSKGMVESVRKEKKARAELEETYKKINVYIKRLKKININLKEKNEDLGALLKISDVATGALNSRKIAQNIVDGVPVSLKHLGYMAGILILYNKSEGSVYTYAITETDIIKKAKKLLDKPFGDHSEQIDDVDNLVMETIKTRQMQIGNKLEDFIAPTVNKNICKLIQKLTRAKSFISIPIFSGGRIKGTIVFVGTKQKNKIIQRDKDILFGFSSHIGSTIESAQLYEQTERQMKELSRLNENLEEANRKFKELLDMKNEFLHITSHQLRTPLTAIRGMISMWYDGDFENLPEKEKKRMLKRILVSADRLNNITNDMLDALELEGGFLKFQFKSASIEKIIKETINTLKPNFDKKNIHIKLKTDLKIPNVEVEPNYIRQVFMNVIDNACKYTRSGGVDINISNDKEYVKIIIRDTGVGISKTDQKNIFEKFTRGRNAVNENASGSGLGLFIAKKIVSAHGGKIEVESEGIGKGTTVKIFLKIKHGK